MPPEEKTFQPDLTKNPGSSPKGPAIPPPMANTPLPNLPANPPSPRSQFEFMLKDPQATKGKLYLPTNLPKPALILIVLVGVVFLALIVSVIFGGSSNNYPQILDLAAQDQEILRVSTTFQQDFNDTSTQNISATAVATLSTQQTQYLNYLATTKYKYKLTQLNSHLNKTTDTNLQNAIQNNNFDATYLAYLKTAVQSYQQSMNTVNQTSTKNFQKILKAAYASNKVLLQSPQLATNSN